MAVVTAWSSSCLAGRLTCVGDGRIGDLKGLNRTFDPSIFRRLLAGADILAAQFMISSD